MVTIEQMLKEAIARDASDIFLVAGHPYAFKINGEIHSMQETRLMPNDTAQLIQEIYQYALQNTYEDFLKKNPGAKIYYATTKAPQTYTDVQYEDDCFIMFGKESAGIPEDILVNNQETCVRIPMIGDIRSLNLSNSVAIVLYEALRQHNFTHMNLEGHLRNYDWK